MQVATLWSFLPIGYALSVLIEAPILLMGLARRHSLRRRLFAGLWLTACTYPIVILVLPVWIDPAESRAAYLAVAETFAALGEAALFWLAFDAGRQAAADGWTTWRDSAVIVAANLASFGGGELLHAWGWC